MIEGINNSTSFSTDSIVATAVPRGTPGSWLPTLSDTVDYTVVEVNAGVDGNRDTEIDFENSYDRQLLFWFNADSEKVDPDGDHERDDPTFSEGADYNDDTISLRRDLEDFANLQLQISSLLTDNAFNMAGSGVPSSDQLRAKYRISLEKAGGSSISLYEAAGSDVLDHVSDESVAVDQVENFGKAIAFAVGEKDLADVVAGVNRFLFEAAGEGVENPTLLFTTEITYPDGKKKTEKRQEIKLELRDFKDFYSRYVIDYLDGATDLRTDLSFQHFDTPVNPAHESHVRDKHFVGTPSGEVEQNLVFVHGWNVPDSSTDDWKRASAETLFKRLYWQGFRGHFVEFDWPTFWDAEGPIWPLIGEGGNLTYNMSEFQAWRSGNALMETIEGLGGESHLLAHSMGNVVAAEALRQSSTENPQDQLVSTYVAMQGALSAGVFGDNTNDALAGFGTFSFIDLYRFWHGGDAAHGGAAYMTVSVL